MALEDSNSLWKRIISPLKARSAHSEELIPCKINVESHEHDDTYMMIGDLISRVLKKNPNIKCDHYGKQGQLNRDCGQDTPTKTFFLRIIHSECLSLLDYVESFVNIGIVLVTVYHWRIFKVTFCHWENLWETSHWTVFQIQFRHFLPLQKKIFPRVNKEQNVWCEKPHCPS